MLRRIYLTVRGPDWSTIPPVLSDVHMETSPDSFVLMFRLDCRQGDADFTWQVSVRGNPDGVVRFDAQGKANRPFDTNRVGICVLHQWQCGR